MKPASAPQQRSTDMVTTIAAAMREMGVTGLPRNYEIFYEVFAGTNENLRFDFLALGNRASQGELDALASKYFVQNNGFGIVDSARAQIETKLDEIKALLNRERTSLEKYGVVLDRTSDGLASRNVVTREFLQRILAITAAATETTREHGKQIASSIVGTSAELEAVKNKLEEYKKLADTDALTQIANRRAFDKALSAIYDDPKGVMFGALILADIDRFKEINDRYGHPVGDSIIRLVAGVLEQSVSGEALVARTGGEEFAVVVSGMSEDAVHQLGEHIRTAIENTPFANRESGVDYGPVTVSVGVCMASEAGGPADLYAKADSAMYASKTNGRNRTTRFSATTTAAGKNWMLYRTE